MKLFKVTLACDVYVLAENGAGAMRVASEINSYDLDVEPDDVYQVRTILEVPREWRDAIPYGEQPDGREDTIDQFFGVPEESK